MAGQRRHLSGSPALVDGSAGFTTEVGSGKVKRIRHAPAVTLQPCSLRGKVRPGSSVVKATAEVLLAADARRVRDAVRNKYRVMTSLLTVGDLFRRLLRRPDPEECAIRLRLD